MATVYIDDAYELEDAIARAVAALPEASRVRPGERVFLKPNLTYPTHRPGVTTSPRFIRAVVQHFTDLGARVALGEGDGAYGAWSADVAFDGHRLRDIADRYGATLVNFCTAPVREVELPAAGRSYRVRLPVVLLEETDAFITLPAPKIHAMTTYSGAVKNQWGCIPDTMRLKRHPDFPGLIWAINHRLRPRMALGDGQYMLDINGPIAGGEPVYMNRVFAADDILAFDVAVARHVMHLAPEQMPYLRLGRRLGYTWDAPVIDRSTGPTHEFALHRTLHNEIIALAFPRQWAVNLLWDSWPGHLAHRVMYAIKGDDGKRQRAIVERDVRRRTAAAPSAGGD